MRSHLLRWFPLLILGFCFFGPINSVLAQIQPSPGESVPFLNSTLSLDGPKWLLAHDPANVGVKEKWWQAPVSAAKTTKVPWIAQDTFPFKHGVFWYWHDFKVPALPQPGRYLLRFWAVDYKANVWLNGQLVGEHEDAETPFTLDVTAAVKPNAVNRLAVRVLNPTHERIDGLVLNEIPHRNKTLPYRAGNAWNQGGIMDSVELLMVPPVYNKDLFVRPDWQTGLVLIQASLHNANPQEIQGKIEFRIAPAAVGETTCARSRELDLPSGDSLFTTQLKVEQPHLWNLNDPFLYRVTVRLRTIADQAPGGFPLPAYLGDEQSARFGFRDFRFHDGAFRLNGKRIYLRCSHTGNCCPIGLEMPHDPDFLRRDLINCKAMGFNTLRFISGVAKRYQLDMCDEIGLMVYEEAYAGWCLADSPKMAERFDSSTLGMVRRDRNHPSVVIWGLLNETPDGPVFRHAVDLLPALRKIDDTRLVLLNSGRWDHHGGDITGLEVWRIPGVIDPCICRNPTDHPIHGTGVTWAPGQLSFHPGKNGEYAVVRWTAPKDEALELETSFSSIAEKATTDVHVLHDGKALFDDFINVQGRGPATKFKTKLAVKAGNTVDCVVGYGNGNYGADSTGLAFIIKTAAGKTYDAAADFSSKQNPNTVWSFGQLSPGPKPDATKWTSFTSSKTQARIGSLSNPFTTDWQNVLDDQHPYQRVPHTADTIRTLRTCGGTGLPLFLSEYGIGAGVDLIRAARHYERLGATQAMDARFYREKLDLFLADWKRWDMAGAFGRPEDFFAAGLKRMAGQRLLGLNAIRANPNVIGHSMTGTVDQGMTGEGLWTTFRELKPGTVNAVFDGWAPLRLCLFTEPVNFYRGGSVQLEAVLANEDQLPPGEYPVQLHVFGPQEKLIWERQITIKIPPANARKEQPFVMPLLNEKVTVQGPAGKYRFVANFAKGAAAGGGETEFFVDDPANMPQVKNEIILWGDDPVLAKWLTKHGIRFRPFVPGEIQKQTVILAGAKVPGPNGMEAFRDLVKSIDKGATVIFLAPEVIPQKTKEKPSEILPIKARLASSWNWLYHADQWARPHPLFEGLPTGLLDYTFYRELISERMWTDTENLVEAVAGTNDTSFNYSSGLLLSVHSLGSGHYILNTLRIRENLGTHPAAERLLRNLLNYGRAGKVG